MKKKVMNRLKLQCNKSSEEEQTFSSGHLKVENKIFHAEWYVMASKPQP